jgi:uncharacterized iron-regulated membrane protein
MKIYSLVIRNPGAAYMARLKSWRKLWLKVHLGLGLVLGLVLSVWGVTGSIWVFGQEIDEWLNPELLTVVPPANSARYLSFAELQESAEFSMPDKAKLISVTYPRNSVAALDLEFSVPTGSGVIEIWQIGINPYTAAITGKRLMQRSSQWLPKTIMGFVHALHPSLLHLAGGVPAGIMASLLLFSILTGLILWWPLTGKWRQALAIKRRASIERFNYDLHKTTGFYTAIVLFVILLSGISMVAPKYFVGLVEIFSPATYRYFFKSIPRQDIPSIELSRILATVNAHYPTGRLQWIYAAPEVTDAYFVCKNDVDIAGSWLQRVCMALDRYTGEFLDIDDPSQANGGEIFMQWQWPLHSGQAFGMLGRILVFVTGLFCPVLYITGVIRWLQKRRVACGAKERFTKISRGSCDA